MNHGIFYICEDKTENKLIYETKNPYACFNRIPSKSYVYLCLRGLPWSSGSALDLASQVGVVDAAVGQLSILKNHIISLTCSRPDLAFTAQKKTKTNTNKKNTAISFHLGLLVPTASEVLTKWLQAKRPNYQRYNLQNYCTAFVTWKSVNVSVQPCSYSTL